MTLDISNIRQKLDYVGEAIHITREILPPEKNIIGFAGAPWTVACYMLEGKSSQGYAKARLFARQNKQDFDQLMAILIHTTSEYLKMQIAAGTDAIQIFDSWAGVLSVEEFRSFVIAPTKEIILRVRDDYPNIPIIGFPKGAHLMLPAFVKQTEINAISLDSGVPTEWAHQRLGAGYCLQGNLDPHYLLHTVDVMIERVERILTQLGKGPFVFNLGHGIDKETPPENVAFLSQYLKEWRR